MYLPRSFVETDPGRLRELCRRHPFATVVGFDDGGPEIAHLPCLYDGAQVRFHLAAANPMARLAAAEERLTAVFHGPHAYVTPRWYSDPHGNVPTWNYASVHLSGRSRTMTESELRSLLDNLSRQFESDAVAPWTLADSDPGYVGQLLAAIVGVVIDVDRVEGKFKLSQNRSPGDRDGVRRGFQERATPDDLALLALMKPEV